MKVTADTGTINQRKMTKDKKLEFLSPCQKGIVPAFTKSLAADSVDFPGQLWVPVIIDKPVENIVKDILRQTADGRIMDLRSIFIHIPYYIQEYLRLPDVFLLQSAVGETAFPDPIMV